MSEVSEGENVKTVWANPTPAGPDHLRPTLISFEEEDEEMVSWLLMDKAAITVFIMSRFISLSLQRAECKKKSLATYSCYRVIHNFILLILGQ